jgi:threonine/homoserine/homoserine lactone efflux protein
MPARLIWSGLACSRCERPAALGLAFSLMTLLWLAAYALAIARIGRLLRGGPVRRLLDGLTGAALVTLGLRLAVEER